MAMLSVNAVPSYAWPFSSVKSSCTVPAGLYKAEQLGAGFDALNIAVNSLGEVQGSYRLSTDAHVHQSPVLYEAWLDSKTSNISCHGNTIDISTSDSGHSLDLSLVWNRSLSNLQVSGSYVGDPTWTRWSIKNGVFIASTAALIYTGWYVYKYQSHFKNFYSGLMYADEADQFLAWADGIFGSRMAGTGAEVWLDVLKKYLFKEHLYDFTLPLAVGLNGMSISPFISNYSTYPLNAIGLPSSSGQLGEVCKIPTGIYFGEVIDPSQGSITLTIHVSEPENKLQTGKVVASLGDTQTFDISPSEFNCQGNELILKWDKSYPASKGGMTAFYDEERGLMMGTGFFSTSGRIWYSTPIPLPVVQFIRNDQ
ncbi:hypothetical protein [Endozoicomonas sp.]|uniref:hypothetical protein n=1 Tax=Endozoicomonas sp. TaxID=1892382 RepID=UPI003AF970AD